MITSAREFFDELGRAQGEAAPCASAALEGTCRVELAGDGIFHLRVAGGRIAVWQPTAHPDCVLRMSEEDFLDLVTGRRNLLTAFLQGRALVTGNLQLAEAVHSMLRAREQRRREADAAQSDGGTQPGAHPGAHP